MSVKSKTITAAIVVVLGLGVTFVLMSLETVETGNEAVLVTFGKVNYEKTIGPGFHIVPFWVNCIPRNIQVKKEEVHAKAFSIDLQEADIVVALNYRPERENINKLYNEYGDEYVERVVVPAVHESVKSGTAKYTAEDIIGQREIVKEAIISDLTNRLARGYIELVELNIVDFDFRDEFKLAVEAKQIMSQQALEEKNKKEKEKWIAEQEIEKARGEAARIAQKAAAVKGNPQVLILNAIEAWQSGGAQVPQILILGGGDSGILIGALKAAFAPLEASKPAIVEKEN